VWTVGLHPHFQVAKAHGQKVCLAVLVEQQRVAGAVVGMQQHPAQVHPVVVAAGREPGAREGGKGGQKVQRAREAPANAGLHSPGPAGKPDHTMATFPSACGGGVQRVRSVNLYGAARHARWRAVMQGVSV